MKALCFQSVSPIAIAIYKEGTYQLIIDVESLLDRLVK